jgi:hypothetical protein
MGNAGHQIVLLEEPRARHDRCTVRASAPWREIIQTSMDCGRGVESHAERFGIPINYATAGGLQTDVDGTSVIPSKTLCNRPAGRAGDAAG